jgi:hypothetical protein
MTSPHEPRSASDGGDDQTAASLLGALYEELRRLAAARMARERPGHTLSPTALVHEAWLRIGAVRRDWQFARAWLFQALGG